MSRWGPARRAAATLVAAAMAIASGSCSARRVLVAEPGPSTGCVDAIYRGRYVPPPPDRPDRSLRIAARACGEQIYLAVRGAVGGPVLEAAIDGDRMILLLPRERRAVEGPSGSEGMWERETGLPFSGRLIARLLAAPDGAAESRTVGAWSIDLVPAAEDERFPERLVGRHDDGGLFEARKRDERPAAGSFVWPQVPADFARVEYDR